MSMREFKGKSLLDLIEDYVVVDLETTGLDPRYDKIIEIAALRVRNGMIADSYSSLINPEQELDPFITELTGITDDDLKDEKTIRFTLAHELGHIILEHSEDNETARKEADCFARNLLCPIPVIEQFNLKSEADYATYFQISEPMSIVARKYCLSDRYYISDKNYQMISEKLYYSIRKNALA